MLENSVIIRKLSANEITDILEELNNADGLWVGHQLPTALKYGKTIYLQQINEQTCEIISSHVDKFPKTHRLLKSIVGEKMLARCYWHKLMPGESIERHDDSGLPFVKNKKIAHRYQIYLNGDSNFLLELNNKNVDTFLWEYSIVDFALEKTHFYQNNSNKPWIFLVFDALNI